MTYQVRYRSLADGRILGVAAPADWEPGDDDGCWGTPQPQTRGV
jgi:hypothetical protein